MAKPSTRPTGPRQAYSRDGLYEGGFSGALRPNNGDNREIDVELCAAATQENKLVDNILDISKSDHSPGIMEFVYKVQHAPPPFSKLAIAETNRRIVGLDCNVVSRI